MMNLYLEKLKSPATKKCTLGDENNNFAKRLYQVPKSPSETGGYLPDPRLHVLAAYWTRGILVLFLMVTS